MSGADGGDSRVNPGYRNEGAPTGAMAVLALKSPQNGVLVAESAGSARFERR